MNSKHVFSHAEYTLTGDVSIPAVLRIGAYETPVWNQQGWNSGEFSAFVNKNGCGHCCVAMAARLHGVCIDPHEEFVRCRALWGAPAGDQGPWLSAAGVAKVLRSLQVPAEAFGVKEQGTKQAAEHILCALREGRQVIFTSNPERDPENPFSKGYHWVMAVAVREDGAVLIANSSGKAAPDGMQIVLPQTVEKALFCEAMAPEDMTWGETERIHEGSGYIIVG